MRNFSDVILLPLWLNKRYYEQIDGKNIDISGEIPFELPLGWEWCRLESLGCFSGGKTPSTNKKEFWNGNILWVTSKDMKAKYVVDSGLKITPQGALKLQILSVGTILFGILRHTFPVAINKKPCTINQDLKALSLYLPELHEFIYNIFCAFKQKILTNCKKTGTTVESIIWEKFIRLLLPIPPFAEQKRIVAQIESLLKFVDEIDKESEMLEKSIKLAKQKVLDLAIRGKLVPQNPEDEPASELLKKIKAEKEALIKVGKLKRDKHESFIFKGDDNCYHENIDGKSSDITGEIPFELPQSWIWCRIGNIGTINPRNHVADDSTMVSFMPMTQLEGGYGSNYTLSERTWQDVKTGFTHIQENDVVFAKITPCFQNRKSAIMRGLKNGYGAGTTELHVIRCFFPVFPEYILWFLKNQTFISDAVSTIQGVVGQQRIDVNFIRNYLLPLPPLSEQKRIVAQVEKLLSVLETMRG